MAPVALFIIMATSCAGLSLVSPSYAMTVAQLELTGGGVNFDSRHHRMLDRLVGQDGLLTMGAYQPMGDIVPSVSTGRRTFSLFTSGFAGAPAPTTTIAGSSITADLSSLFFGISRGGAHRVWNIGGPATGLYNPDTREFCLSWDRLFDGRKHDRPATFFLTGVVQLDAQPVPIPATLALYATGVFALGAWSRWGRSMRVNGGCSPS